VQQGEGLLDDPANGAQPRSVLGATAGDHRRDALGPDQSAVAVVVVAAIGVDLQRSPPRLATFAADGGHRVEQRDKLGDVVAVAAGEQHREWNTAGVGDEVMLGARPAAVYRAPTAFGPPLSARIHQQLLELMPGGAKKFLTRGQASYLLRTAPAPTGVVAQTRHQLARELIDELTTIDAKIKAADKQLRQLVAATGSSLPELNGIGPSGAARLIGDIGDIARFATAAHFASWNGTAPLETSSGDQKRHRLSRAGNRRINRVLYIMAVVQLRHDTPAAPTTGAAWPRAKRPWKPSARSNATSPTWSTSG